MGEMLSTLYIARHGETARSLSGQHTGLTDLPLTDRGQSTSRRLGNQLRGRSFGRRYPPVHRSERAAHASWLALAPKLRSIATCSNGTTVTTRVCASEIHAKRPGWELFRDGCPRGESASDVGARAYRMVDRMRAV
jgi:broad specificity phosphatase PhoE